MKRRAGFESEPFESEPFETSVAGTPPPVRQRRRRIRPRQQQPEPRSPWYVRMLRLRHLRPSGVVCFVFLEGSIGLAVLLAFAELVSWWGVIVVPLTVAAMVKLNDYVAGKLQGSTPL